MLNMYRIDVCSLSGLNDYSLLRLLGETGVDMSRFPSVKHFVSWCQLSPRHSRSGKINRRIRVKNKSKTGQVFREAAQSLITSKYTAIGAFMRKVRSRRGSTVAIKAGARKLAEAYYNLLTKGQQYVEQGVKKYEQKLKEREIKLLSVLARNIILNWLKFKRLGNASLAAPQSGESLRHKIFYNSIKDSFPRLV